MAKQDDEFEKRLAAFLRGKDSLREWYEIQQNINSSLDGYIDGIKDVGKLTSDIKNVKSQIKELEKDSSKEAKEKIAFLKLEEQQLIKNREVIKGAIKDANKLNIIGGAAIAGVIKGAANLDKIPNFITGKLGLLKGMFEMDKTIRTTVTQMGVLGKQGDVVRNNIKGAALNTISFGAGIKEIAEIQAQYTETLGRNVTLNEKSLEAIAEMGKSTGLGLEGATEMSAEFDKMGVSAEKTGMFVQQALDNSSAMGLNATKVMKNIAGNIKMLNKYRFKDGVKGLIKMAELATKLGVEVDFAAGMSDKLWNIEGAVEMSAQLNVMGGAWAQMADPFKLMYQARNDMKGLTENIAKAAAASMSFAQDGSIELNALEMHRLKLIAEQTGLEYEKLVELGKTKFKLDKINMQVSGSDEFKEFIANTAEFKDGKAYIQLESGKKLVSLLTDTDKKAIQTQIENKKAMKARADAAQSFDEKITNLIDMVKITMMPIIEGITNVLGPVVDDLMGEKGKGFRDELKSLGEQIGGFISTAASWFKGVANLAIALGPKGIFYTWLTGKALMFLFEKANWVLNGFALSQGFLGGQAGGSLASTLAKGFARTAGPLMATAAAGVAGGMAGKWLGEKATEASGRKSTKAGDNWGTGLAIAGGLLGLALAPFTAGGSLALTAAAVGGGALAGGALGKFGGDYFNQDEVPTINDGIVKFNKNDKFTKVDDSTMIAGTNENGNKELAKSMKYASLASLPFGLGMPVLRQQLMMDSLKDRVSGGNNAPTSKIELGDLNITGEIKITLPGGTQIGQEIMKSQEFRSSITRIVTSQLEKNRNGGKTQP